MTNKEIAKTFQFLAKIMELHGESSFKTKSYTNAYMTIRKLPDPLSDMSTEERSAIKGFGKAIVDKIDQLVTTGELTTMKQYTDITPVGIQELLTVKGLGPKKIRTIWDDLEVTTPGELLYACNENRLSALKGFGAKTQETLKGQLLYFLDSKGKSHYASVEELANHLIGLVKTKYPDHKHEITGEMRRQNIIIHQIDILTTADRTEIIKSLQEQFESFESQEDHCKINSTKVYIHQVNNEAFVKELFITTGPTEYINTYDVIDSNVQSEEEICKSQDRAYLPPYLRDNVSLNQKRDVDISKIVNQQDIKGVIHNHSVWSDGINTVKEMAQEAKALGYQYMLMTDHSQSAFYANGLSEDRVLKQMEEIDILNESLEDFVVYKGIESDILNNGALDYEDEILELFDVVIASVHSNLRMDMDKATKRVLAAIQNPFTHILGHPTGRLLLSREGYPLDFDQIIQACADNDVVIELNANPHRLDLDWTLIQQTLSAGVTIAINPDAHSIAGIKDIKYGVLAAQKGGLTKDMCLNTKSLPEFQKWVDSLKY